LYPFLLLPLIKSKDLLSHFLECLIEGVDVQLLFFPQDLEVVFQLPSKNLSDPVISQFARIKLVAPALSTSCPSNFSETTATNRL